MVLSITPRPSPSCRPPSGLRTCFGVWGLGFGVEGLGFDARN